MERELIWDKYRVFDVWRLRVEEPVCVELGTTIRGLLPKFVEDLRIRHIYVVDEERRLVRVVRMSDILHFLFPGAATEETTNQPSGMFSILSLSRKIGALSEDGPFECLVEEVMNDEPKFVSKDALLSDVAQVFMRENISELPVVENQLVGQVNAYEMIDVLLKEMDQV